MSKPTLALTGATGFVGGHLLRLAREAGHEVRALTRGARLAEPGIAWIEGALDRPEALAELCAGADAVIHVAGLINAPDRAGFEAVNVGGTARLIDAARGAGVKPCSVIVIAIGVAGPIRHPRKDPLNHRQSARQPVMVSLDSDPSKRLQGEVTQVANVAHLPGILRASIAMPDIHWGYGFPIGGVAAYHNAVSVVGVGFDIACGNAAIRTVILGPRSHDRR